MSLVIRKAVPADMVAICAIENEPPFVSDTFCDDLLKLLMPSTYVAVESDVVVGFITAHTLTSSVLKLEKRGFTCKSRVPKKGAKLKDVLKVVNIKVLRAHQMRGIGKRLVRYILDKRHKFVDYESPYDGKHVIASCCSAQEYKMLQVSPTGIYTNGATAHRFSFERV